MESGQIIAGKYRINRLLGSGGMAEVWSATNVFTEREFAVKILHTSVGKTAEAKARFLKEAKVSARVDHPNVIEIIDVGQIEDGSLFLVMELLTGVSLETALKRQEPPMSLYEFGCVMLAVAEALSAAHKSSVVHRDLKPTNIFLHQARGGVGVPKVLDFGVSKFLEEDTNQALTVAGTVLGSPYYMSPEQARGEAKIDGRSDIFAFGAIFFEGLTGYRPFDATNLNALIVQIATTRPKEIDRCAPQMPESIRRVIRACLEIKAANRVANFDLVAQMLAEALPEIESLDLHLPRPDEPEDPEITDALPIMRSGSRPGIAASASGRFASTNPSQTPKPSYSSIAPQAMGATDREGSPTWLLASGAALAIVAVAAGVGFSLRHRAAVVAALPPAAAELPTLGVDAMKLEAGEAPLSPGQGRVIVQSTSGSCSLSIDSVLKGMTPIVPIDITAGDHKLECRTETQTRTTTVSVPAGGKVRYTFALDK